MICLGLEGYFRCLSCLYFLSFLVCAWVSIINVEKSSSLFLIFFLLLLFSSVIPNACRLLFSHSVVPDSLWPHGLQHAKLPCPLVSPTVLSNSCPSNWWCHSTILSSVIPFSRLPSVFPHIRSFPMSQFFASGGQIVGVSASVLPMNIQDWFPLGLTGLISLQPKGPSRVFSSTTVQKHQFFSTQPFLWSNSHICTWLLEKL